MTANEPTINEPTSKEIPPGGVIQNPDSAILETVFQILSETKKPLLAREIIYKLSQRGIDISKQALNQILWQKNTRQDLKHDNTFRWFAQAN